MIKSIIAKIDNSVLNEFQINRIIEMEWEERTPLDAVKFQFGLSKSDIKALMKKELKFSIYKLCR